MNRINKIFYNFIITKFKEIKFLKKYMKKKIHFFGVILMILIKRERERGGRGGGRHFNPRYKIHKKKRKKNR